MSDEPKVTIAQDDGTEMQWGKNLLYFKDAAKWTLNKKVLTVGITVAVVVIAFIQMVVSPKSVEVVEGIPILPGGNVEQRSITIDRGQTASQGTEKKGVVQKFTAPKIVLRPKDLKA